MGFPGTIPELLERAAAHWPDHPYLQIRSGSAVSVRTFSQVAADARALAAGIVQSGIGRGDRIALLGENSPGWVTHYFAIAAAGVSIVPLDSLMSTAEITNILVQSKARAVIASRKFRDAVRAVAAEHSLKLFALELDADPAENPLPRVHGRDLAYPSPSDLAVVIFTSGTTGFSKGVMLSHHNLCTNVDGVLQAIQVLPSDNFHLLLPLHHTYSSTVNMLVSMGAGARATFATSYKSRDIVDDIRIAGVTFLVGVPQVFENIQMSMKRAVADAPAARRVLFHTLFAVSTAFNRLGVHAGGPLFKRLREKAGMPSVRYMVSGGAALRPEVNRFFQTLGFTLLQGYGLTETSPILTVNRPHRNRIGSVGLTIPRVDVSIDSPDAVTGIGEICGRGPNIMMGYFENPEATANVLRDGWFHTGDAGFLDKDGFLFITGRVKNVIITGAGKNVYPEEIEAHLNASPYVLESLVVGLERKRGTGEELFALLVPDKAVIELDMQKGKVIDLHTEFDAVVEQYNRHVPAYRRIRQWQLHEQEFEKTSTRKIKRFAYQGAFSAAKS